MERREQRAARELKTHFQAPTWLQDHADGFQLDTGLLHFKARHDGSNNSVSVEIRLFADSEEVLQTFTYQDWDYNVDVKAIAVEWMHKQMVKYIVKIYEVKV